MTPEFGPDPDRLQPTGGIDDPLELNLDDLDDLSEGDGQTVELNLDPTADSDDSIQIGIDLDSEELLLSDDEQLVELGLEPIEFDESLSLAINLDDELEFDDRDELSLVLDEDGPDDSMDIVLQDPSETSQLAPWDLPRELQVSQPTLRFLHHLTNTDYTEVELPRMEELLTAPKELSLSDLAQSLRQSLSSKLHMRDPLAHHAIQEVKTVVSGIRDTLGQIEKRIEREEQAYASGAQERGEIDISPIINELEILKSIASAEVTVRDRIKKRERTQLEQFETRLASKGAFSGENEAAEFLDRFLKNYYGFSNSGSSLAEQCSIDFSSFQVSYVPDEVKALVSLRNVAKSREVTREHVREAMLPALAACREQVRLERQQGNLQKAVIQIMRGNDEKLRDMYFLRRGDKALRDLLQDENKVPTVVSKILRWSSSLEVSALPSSPQLERLSKSLQTLRDEFAPVLEEAARRVHGFEQWWEKTEELKRLFVREFQLGNGKAVLSSLLRDWNRGSKEKIEDIVDTYCDASEELRTDVVRGIVGWLKETHFLSYPFRRAQHKFGKELLFTLLEAEVDRHQSIRAGLLEEDAGHSMAFTRLKEAKPFLNTREYRYLNDRLLR